MSLSDRDRKLLLFIVPAALVAAFYLLALKPKQEEARVAGQALTEQREKRDAAVARVEQLSRARSSFAGDYATVVRLGKAVPTNPDVASLLVQLERSARGTGISFTKISEGQRNAAQPAAGGSGAGKGAGTPAGAGGAPAQSGPGKATESANNAGASSEAKTSGTQGAGGGETDTTTSASSKKGGLPVGGGATSNAAASGGPAAPPGLDSVPLEMEFRGSFGGLADFFHRLKRYVRVVNDQVQVRGRLITIDAFRFSSDESFPKLKAELKATIYLSPKSEGTTAGASPGGPSSTPASSTPGSPAPAAPAAPTAAVNR